MRAARRIHKRVLRWGDSYGIRLTKADLERLNLRENQDVDIDLEPCTPNIDWENLPDLHLGTDASTQHDEILYAGRLRCDARPRSVP